MDGSGEQECLQVLLKYREHETVFHCPSVKWSKIINQVWGPSRSLPFLLLASPAERTVGGVEGREKREVGRGEGKRQGRRQEGEAGGEVDPGDRKHLLSTWALIVNDFISFILLHGS